MRAVEIVNADGLSDYFLTCEHASNFIPAAYDGLGLPAADLERHIAWDIGAANVARTLSGLIDAPLFLSGYSRLLIDCNRPVGSTTSIPEVSETTAIPGNVGVSRQEAERRARDFYWPFQDAITRHLDWRKSTGRKTIILGIHSFTPVFKGFARPWHAGILFRDAAQFGQALVEALTEAGLSIAANQPYTIDDESDYTVPIHGERRGLEAVLVEIRQDLIADTSGAETWSHRMKNALAAIPTAAPGATPK